MESIFHAIIDSIFILFPDYSLQMVNQATLNRYGKESAEILGEKCYKVYRNRKKPCYGCPMKYTIKTKMPAIGKIKERTISGDYVQLSTYPLIDEREELIGVIAYGKLVTEEKRMGDRIKYLAELVENASDCIFSTNKRGEIVSFNKAAEETFGYKREEVFGKKWKLLIAKRSSHLAREILQKTLKETRWAGELWALREEGIELPVHMNTATITEEGNKIKGFIGIVRDIQDQRQMQEQLIRSEKLAGIGILASGIGHEINNPLHGIMGMAEASLYEDDPQKVKKYLRDIIEYSKRAAEIVRSLSTYTRTARDNGISFVSPPAVMEDALKMAMHASKLKNIEVIKDFQPVPKIKAIPGEIQQIFINLITNAIQAMEGNGKLTLSITPFQNFVKIKVEDNGPGIPREYIKLIFDPFFTTKEPGEGTGLGLYIVYKLATKYKGLVDVWSKEGKGASFTVKLPITEAGDGVRY